jgi:hypothetical protein
MGIGVPGALAARLPGLLAGSQPIVRMAQQGAADVIATGNNQVSWRAVSSILSDG